jgi:hypothetical protein
MRKKVAGCRHRSNGRLSVFVRQSAGTGLVEAHGRVAEEGKLEIMCRRAPPLPLVNPSRLDIITMRYGACALTLSISSEGSTRNTETARRCHFRYSIIPARRVVETPRTDCNRERGKPRSA